ncbi:hypothetical protein ACERK3_01870 [Phycisphaerales bacterium AB-hyl4]|uniref:Sporulation related protein n=1 Tax=Natronomicrosphaera hydrolytica TaxID=3242702 RepID=A0ABV4U0A5_9BACT
MRRNRSTPFEVMGQATRGVEPAREPVSRAPAWSSEGGIGGGLRGLGDRFAFASDWWASLGAGSPVVLRVPRGLAVVLVVALVGLLMLSYWVGHSRGTSAGVTAAEEAWPVEDSGIRAAPVRRGGNGGAGGATAGVSGAAEVSSGASGEPSAGGGGQAAAVSGDPREPGRNYFVLAFYPPDAARVLADWLAAEHGVATVLESVQNRRELEVIAVDRGFHREDLSSEERREYERELRAIGRAWQRHNRGRGDALESMYPKRYNGP